MDRLARLPAALGVTAHLNQVAALLQAAGQQLFIAQGFDMADFGGQVAVGRRSQAQMFGPQAGHQFGGAAPLVQRLGTGPFGNEPVPAQLDLPWLSRVTGSRFIGGLPMNCATNRLAGHW